MVLAGQPGAKAGMGVVAGVTLENVAAEALSRPITEKTDGNWIRSSQRAELLAAHLGVRVLAHLRPEEEEKATEEDTTWIIATDSEYVVKGMTEWLPKWKKNGFRTSQGKTPTNLDLFKRLDTLVLKYEGDGYTVGFCHIPRSFNTDADRLAKAAAASGTVANLS